VFSVYLPAAFRAKLQMRRARKPCQLQALSRP
jgi:hypothetical protein